LRGRTMKINKFRHRSFEVVKKKGGKGSKKKRRKREERSASRVPDRADLIPFNREKEKKLQSFTWKNSARIWERKLEKGKSVTVGRDSTGQHTSPRSY